MMIVALAGGVGAGLRFLTDRMLAPVLARFVRVVSATVVINVVGSFVLGLVVGLAPVLGSASVIVGTGLCGGFTTFSTASVEAASLVERGYYRVALSRVTVMCVASVAAAWCGWLFAVSVVTP